MLIVNWDNAADNNAWKYPRWELKLLQKLINKYQGFLRKTFKIYS